MKKKDLLFSILSFVVPFYVYCYTLCPTVSVTADAGEFPTFAFISGFAHPPGYPLFTLILKLFLKIPFANPALKANLAVAFIAAASLPFFYLICRNLLNHSLTAFVTTLNLAFTKIYWRNALVSEVFSLLAFFIITTFLFYQLWLKTREKRYLYLFIFFSGFGLAHHQILLVTLILLFIDYCFTKNRPPVSLHDLVIILPLGVIGFFPYIYIYNLVQNSWPLMNWENPRTLTGIFRLITRSSYGTFILTAQAQKIDFLNQMKGIGRIYLNSFQPVSSFLIIIGCWLSLKMNRRFFFYSLVVFLLMGVLFAYSSGMPLNQPMEIPYLERFQIIPTIFLSLVIGFALIRLVVLKPKLEMIILLVPVFLLGVNFKAVSQRNNYFGENLASDLVWQIPPKSIFIVEGDPIINVLFYHRYVLGQNKEIAFVLGNLLANKPNWYHEEIKTFYPDLILPAQYQNGQQYLNEFLSANSKEREVFIYFPGLESTLGLDLPKEPHGLIWRYLSANAQPSSITEMGIELQAATTSLKNLISPRQYPYDWTENVLTRLYADLYIYLAEMNHEYLNLSESYYQKAMVISPNYFLPKLELADDYEMFGETDKAVKFWQEALKCDLNPITAQNILEKIQKYQTKK